MALTLELAITLSVSYQITQGRLEINYVVVNGSPQDVYVFDKAYAATPGGLAVREDALLLSVEQPDTVILSSKLLPIPPGATFAVPPTAWGTLVKAGERRTGKANMSLPLRFDPKAERAKHHVFSMVRFELGYVADSPDLAAKPTSLESVFELGRAAWKNQIVLRTDPQRLAIAGMKKD